MADNCDLQNVSKEEMGALYNGDMRFTPSGLTYKNRSTGKVFQLSNDDIESVSQNFMANQPGWNFGNVPIVDKNLQFQVNNALDFEIPLSNVSNCTANKSEAILEFHTNDDSTVGLVEMRLHMPMVEGVSEEESPAELLRQAILKYAAVEAETEQHIVLLTNMLCLTPRGRYDIKIFPTFLSFHGKTYDYKIPARSVNRLFMLKHKDGRRLFFVMHINPPIRQGQTRYSYIVFEFNKDELAE
uniref:FACT complex subunit SSRP1 n=1 Tax=Panagrolaimus sp. PS1159 TaxID=55785 RepID=A0AC35GW80_9BILA